MTQPFWLYFTAGFLSCWFLIGATIIVIDTFFRRLEPRLGGVLYGFLAAPAMPAAVLLALLVRVYNELSGVIKRKSGERKSF